MKQEIQQTLTSAFKAWAKEQTPHIDPQDHMIAVDPPPANIPGDAASGLPMSLAKKAKKPPRQVAEEIKTKLPANNIIERIDIAGPGFLNFFIQPEWLWAQLKKILTEKDQYGCQTSAHPQKILIEFVSANPTGPLHVGHGRGAALGDALSRILCHAGHQVTTEYYVNDVGNQMENLGASIMGRCEELSPDSLTEEEKKTHKQKNPEDLYKGEYIREIARAIIAAHPSPHKRAQGTNFFRQTGIDAILKTIKQDLDSFRVELESWFPESTLFQKNSVDKSIDFLKQKGRIKTEAGALWFLSSEFGDEKDRVLKRQDSRPTYFASDVAYHYDKFQRGYDKLLNIWGTDHHGYVPRVKAVIQALGHDPQALTVLLYQLVSLVRGGKPVAMSTRSGEFVTLKEVIEEVGADACRFFFALRSPNSHLEFDLDLAKKQASENPVFYVKYVHARCCSIFREAQKRGITYDESAAFPAPDQIHPQERSLLVKLALYPDIIHTCCSDLSPHHLTNYLLSLAGEYHRFYEQCRVLDDTSSVTQIRLSLVDGVRAIIHNGLSLLGITAPEEM